jgi:predicted amidohydrolase
MAVTPSLPDNLARILSQIDAASVLGVQIILFPECALTGYSPAKKIAENVSLVPDALAKIQSKCRDSNVSAIVGSAILKEEEEAAEAEAGDAADKVLNAALIISHTGEMIGYQPKLQLVPTDSFASPGDTLHTFTLHGVTMSVVICHDIRHPELCRLPVLAGSRVLFYMSFETWHDDGPVPVDGKDLEPYEAQARARAVENRVFLVHSNVAGDHVNRGDGSHGSSRIVSPTGDVLAQGGVFGEELLVCDLALEEAHASYARESVDASFFLRKWYDAGIGYVNSLN